MHCVEKKILAFRTAAKNISDSNENYSRYNFPAFANISGNFPEIFVKFTTLPRSVFVTEKWHYPG